MQPLVPILNKLGLKSAERFIGSSSTTIANTGHHHITFQGPSDAGGRVDTIVNGLVMWSNMGIPGSIIIVSTTLPLKMGDVVTIRGHQRGSGHLITSCGHNYHSLQI